MGDMWTIRVSQWEGGGVHISLNIDWCQRLEVLEKSEKGKGKKIKTVRRQPSLPSIQATDVGNKWIELSTSHTQTCECVCCTLKNSMEVMANQFLSQ